MCMMGMYAACWLPLGKLCCNHLKKDMVTVMQPGGTKNILLFPLEGHRDMGP